MSSRDFQKIGLFPAFLRLIVFRLQFWRPLLDGFRAIFFMPKWLFYVVFRANVSHAARKRHTYITGGSGSGKSELLKILIHDLLIARSQQSASFVIIDPHGDFCKEVATWREFQGKGRGRLVYLDQSLSASHGFTMNPLQISDRSARNVNRVARGLVSVFIELMENATLSNQMEALLVPCLTVLLERQGSTLLDLKRFMDDERNEDLIALGMRSDDEAIRAFFGTAFHGRTYGGTKAALYSRLQRLLNSVAFRELTCSPSTLNLIAEIERGAFVVFNLSKGTLDPDTSQAFGRFVIATLQAHVLKRAALPVEKRRPIHLIIDEFQNFICPSVGDILAESRKYKLFLTASQQMLGQKMSTEFSRLILGNSHIKMAGPNEYHTTSSLSKETGIPPSAISSLRVGEFAVKVGNRRPIFLQVPRFLLGTKNSMPACAWKDISNDQLQRYYSPLRGAEYTQNVLAEEGVEQIEFMTVNESRRMLHQGMAIEPPRFAQIHPVLQ